VDLAFKWPFGNEGVLVSPGLFFPETVNFVLHSCCVLFITILFYLLMGCLLDTVSIH